MFPVSCILTVIKSVALRSWDVCVHGDVIHCFMQKLVCETLTAPRSCGAVQGAHVGALPQVKNTAAEAR